jgi:hypothetical protein
MDRRDLAAMDRKIAQLQKIEWHHILPDINAVTYVAADN